ncbi:MAG TPA: MBL fold metallo-hydrolase [Candidatus Dormibacteraeota bacterium]
MEELLLTEVAEGVHELRLPIPFEDGHVNVFLLPVDGAVDLIDCGMNAPESLDLLRTAMGRVAGESAGLRKLIVTHIHPDHYGAAGVLTHDWGAQLYLHRLEIPLVHPRYLALDALVAEVHRYLLANGVPEVQAEVMQNASRSFAKSVTTAPMAIPLDGAETLEVGRRKLRVEWTPGHSPGHICLFDTEDRLLFAGDELLPEDTPNIGLHPQSTPNPLADFLGSLQRLAELDPQLVLPAHGRPFTTAAERVAVLTEFHERRKRRILEILDGRTVTAWEVALGLWGNREHHWEQRLALQEALAHLQTMAEDDQLLKLVSAEAVRWRTA